MSQLDVYLHGELAGQLRRDDHARLEFTYDPNWVDNKGQPLSFSLPVQAETYDNSAARPYFAGLLPEGQFLRDIARAFGVSANNAFSLLDAIGGECAGAVSLQPPDQTPPHGGEPTWLSIPELERLIRSLPTAPLALLESGEGLRLSLAGAQQKLPVVFEEGSIGITRGSPPSTHILKILDSRFPGLVANEAYCMTLGQELGVEVADAAPWDTSGFEHQADDIDFLLVTRYDRGDQDGKVRRLHQEDFCQALGYLSEQKYESDGGPTLTECGDLLRRTSALPARDILRLIDAVLLNYVIGNHDAHGKNFSLLVEGEAAPRLAPLYDLVSTAAIPGTTRKMAMKIGGEYRPQDVERRHWERFGSGIGVRLETIQRRGVRILDRLPAGRKEARSRIGDFADDPVVDVIEGEIDRRAGWLRSGLL